MLCSGQQLAQQMQQSNPELVEQLRSQMRGTGQSNAASSSEDTTNTDQSQPGRTFSLSMFTSLAIVMVYYFLSCIIYFCTDN